MEFSFQKLRTFLSKIQDIEYTRLRDLFDVQWASWKDTKYVLSTLLFASLLISILSLALPIALLQIYDRIMPNQSMDTLIILILGVLIALILEAFFRIVRSYVTGWADARFEYLAGYQAFERLLSVSLADYEREGPGVHLKRFNALNQLRDFYSGQAFISLIEMGFVVILFALLFYIGKWLVLVPIFMLIILAISFLMQTENLDKLLANKNVQDDRHFNFIIEVLSRMHSLKGLAMEAQILRRYERLQRTAAGHDYNLAMKSSDAMLWSLILAQITVVLVVSAGSFMVIHRVLTIGGLAACTLLSTRCLQPVMSMLRVFTRLKSVTLAKKELEKIVHLKRESSQSQREMSKINGEIEWVDVSFSYTPDTTIFDSVSLKIQAKQAVGITGLSQSGKTTFTNLLLSVFKPTGGKILIDDEDISLFNPESVRKQIAYLYQTEALFSGTIMDNLTLFQDQYRDRAKHIAEQLGLVGVIDHLPEGYDTPVASQIVEILPRGIIQRIAIARALLLPHPIVIFDEANLSLDRQSDDMLKNFLLSLKGQCTLILISHRPSYLSIADTKYVIRDRKIELLA